MGRPTHRVRVRRKRHASVGESPGVYESNQTPNEKSDTQPGPGRYQSGSGETETKRHLFSHLFGPRRPGAEHGNDFEPDGYDETWCLYDGELIDDELYAALKQFVRGVRIFVLSDSCHSGTVLRAVHFSALGLTPARPRMMPRDIALRVYMDHEKFYDKLQKTSATRRTRMDATAVLISGCQDNQTSADGDRNGLFTETLLAVWKNGKFNGDYHGFHESIVKLMPPTQSPNYFARGRTNEQFESQKPFTV